MPDTPGHASSIAVSRSLAVPRIGHSAMQVIGRQVWGEYLDRDDMHLRRIAGDEIGARGCLRLRLLRRILGEPPGRGHRRFLALGQGRTETGAGTEG
jgi:hypothetical protein